MTVADAPRPAPGRPHPVRGLYVIADAGLVPGRELLPRARAALEGGARVLQLRSKAASAAERLAQARVLQVLCADFAVPLIVNDDLEAAAALGAGLHIGGDDAPVTLARRTLGECALIGRSCYNRIELAEQALRDGADHIAFGRFFASTTKPQAVQASPALLRQAAPLGLPRVAIGGIDAGNAAGLLQAGADALAVIGSVFCAADPRAAARRLAAVIAAASELPAASPVPPPSEDSA